MLSFECDELRRDKDALAAEIRELREKEQKQMAMKVEAADRLTDCAMQRSGEANGCSNGHVQHVKAISFTGTCSSSLLPSTEAPPLLLASLRRHTETPCTKACVDSI